jgi:hypothetical protein
MSNRKSLGSVCTHPGPIPFGSSDVSWDASGLIGRVVLPCRDCGESLLWTVEEE